MKYLNLGPEDSMLVITSAGDNALHYAIAAQPKRVSGSIKHRQLCANIYLEDSLRGYEPLV
jgi:hypothetical protein